MENNIRFFLIGLFTMLLLFSSIHQIPSIQGHVDTSVSAFATLTPTIDGVKSSAEWNDAAQVSVFSGSLAGSTFYVKNDENNLYLALNVLDSTLSSQDIWEVRFDNTHDGVNTIGDDNIFVAFSNQTRTTDAHFDGKNSGIADSVQNGAGAVSGDGTTNFFEISHPLNSGDPNDFSLSTGDTVGFCLRYFKEGHSRTDTMNYPPNCVLMKNAQALYVDIVIAGPDDITPPAIPSDVVGNQVDQCPGASIENNDCFFVPSEVIINVGDTVVWTNSDTATHTVTSGDVDNPDIWGNVFDSGVQKPDERFEHTFDNPGIYPYLCMLHPWMAGKVIVIESDQITIDAVAKLSIDGTLTVSGSINPYIPELRLPLRLFILPVTIDMGDPEIFGGPVDNPLWSQYPVSRDSRGLFGALIALEGDIMEIRYIRISIQYGDTWLSGWPLGTSLGVLSSIMPGKLSITDTRLVDRYGDILSQQYVGQRVFVESTVTNHDAVFKPYAHIIQVKDSNNMVMSLSWDEGYINPDQSIVVTQEWLPDNPGLYTVEIFVWHSIDDPIPLTADVMELRINVSVS